MRYRAGQKLALQLLAPFEATGRKHDPVCREPHLFAVALGMQPYDAYTLCSLAGDVRVSRTFRPISPVKMMLSRKALEQVG